MAASNNRDHSIIASSRHICIGVVFRAHSKQRQRIGCNNTEIYENLMKQHDRQSNANQPRDFVDLFLFSESSVDLLHQNLSLLLELKRARAT